MGSAKLLLVDGYSMAFRAFYGVPVDNFATNSGQPTNAVYGFFSMLLQVLKTHRPTHVGVAWDASRASFRTTAYQEYKATRGDTPPQFLGQPELIREILDAANITHLEKADYEADDIIATLAARGAAQGMEVLIYSGDRDLIQMITEHVKLLWPGRGVGGPQVLGPKEVLAKYDVPPERYPELAALVGETSDNLPGVPGVGPKTAAKWINSFDGLDNLLAHTAEVPGKVGVSLREHLDDVRRNRRLNALVTTLDLPCDPSELALKPADAVAINRVFDALQIRHLRYELLSVLGADLSNAPTEAVAAPARITGVLNGGELADWLAKRTGTPVGLDFRVIWAYGGGDIDSIAFADATEAAWVKVLNLSLADDAALGDWLADEAAPKVLHGAKKPLLACWQRGWDLRGIADDTELSAYLLRPDQRVYSLDSLSQQFLGRPLTPEFKEPETAQGTLDFGEVDIAEPNEAMARAGVTRDLAAVFDTELAQVDERELLTDIELPLTRILAKMEAVGICVDVDLMTRLRADVNERAVTAERAAYDVIGKQVNLGSPKQLQTLLFDELQMPKTKKIKTGYTTDAEALADLYAKTSHPFLAHLLQHRDAIKLRQMIDTLLAAVADDTRIHTTFQQTVAGTGRLSSADPNLQNIPIRTEEGRRIREAFVMGAGYDGLLSVDYSQIEMRVMADASGDEQLIEAFRSGVDFHTVTASRVFGIPAAEVTPAQRSSVKQMNYGLAYGLSAYGLSNRLGVSVGQARALMDDYFATFAGVRDYLRGVVDEARSVGYTQTRFGRRRYLPDLNSPSYQLREMAERAALNAPIQGTAADIIKVAMIKVDAALTAAGLSSRMLLQIHDELLFEVALGERERLQTVVSEVMRNATTLSVPLEVSVGFG
ncbi:MAG: DNA polymerase I, partial [Propionibacteriaceae bacterium]|nr:DNA polymerase I [Propionibacteriaceae bacterium]